MKKIALIAALGLMGMGSAMAQTATGGFNVDVTLTSQCRINTAYTTQTVQFAYTAFGAGVNSTNTPEVSFECTRNFAPTSVAFDGTNGTTAGVGVVGGLQYALTATAQTTTAGAVATTSSIGSADIVRYQISGTMAGNQAGDATASASIGRQLIISF